MIAGQRIRGTPASRAQSAIVSTNTGRSRRFVLSESDGGGSCFVEKIEYWQTGAKGWPRVSFLPRPHRGRGAGERGLAASWLKQKFPNEPILKFGKLLY